MICLTRPTHLDSQGRYESQLIAFTFSAHLQAIVGIGCYNRTDLEKTAPVGAMVLSVLAVRRLIACSSSRFGSR